MPTTSDLFEEEGGIQNVSGLCLSGGGYRATIFHLGSLWRLNETGHLRQFQRISSVSGGSITAGVLGLNWKKLNWNAQGVATNFPDVVVAPVRRMARISIDVVSVLGGMFSPFSSAGDKVAKAYDKHLFDGATLQDLPESANSAAPRFIINATNLQSGVLWRFSRPFMGDYKVGLVRSPAVPLATAVAASSAFPPFLSPVRLNLKPFKFEPHDQFKFLEGKFRETAILSDGGVYDNMGMETVWKRCRTVLISDAGGALPVEEDVASDWPRHSIRVLSVIDNQVRSLRKRQIVDEFRQATDHTGAYWSIRQTPQSFTIPATAGTVDPVVSAAVMAEVKGLPFDSQRAAALAFTPTRLKAMDDKWQESLINLGYIISAAALGSYALGPHGAAKLAWPYAGGLG